MGYVIAYDVGTTGVKTCLFSMGETVEFVDGAYHSYQLYILDNGGAEQDGDEWWNAMCKSTAALLAKTGVSKDEIIGISFCSQMQGLVLVDKEGNLLRRPMSYMDQRAEDVMNK